jgi:hypothetical protein
LAEQQNTVHLPYEKSLPTQTLVATGICCSYVRKILTAIACSRVAEYSLSDDGIMGRHIET